MQSATSLFPKNLVAYDFSAWNDFMLPAVFPNIRRVRASIYDESEKILKSLPSRTRCFLFHLDCTITKRFPLCRPELIHGLRYRDIQPLNERVSDISKRSIQQKCIELGLPTTSAQLDGDPDELVIVKTNLNWGGGNESRFSLRERRLLGLPAVTSSMRSSKDYKVLRRADVPAECWNDARFVVERFIYNTTESWHRLYVCFDRLILTYARSRGCIKKFFLGMPRADFRLRRTVPCKMNVYPDDFPLDIIVRFINAIGLDFGAVDIVHDDSRRYFLVDVNTTPHLTGNSKKFIAHLRGCTAKRDAIDNPKESSAFGPDGNIGRL